MERLTSQFVNVSNLTQETIDMAPKRQRLILNGPEFTTRATNFAHLMAVPSFQKRFFSDPSGIAAEEFGLKVSASAMTKANGMIYALLSDRNFNGWAKKFQKEVEASFPKVAGAKSLDAAATALKSKKTRDQLIEKFNSSVVAHLSNDAAAALGAVNKGPLVSEGDVAIVLLTFVAVIVVVLIAAGVAKPGDLASRLQVQLVVRQLSAAQALQARSLGR